MARKVPGVTKKGDQWYATAFDPKIKRKVRVKNPETGKTAFPTQSAAAKAKEDFEITKRDEARLADGTRSWTVREWRKEWVENPLYARKSETTNKFYKAASQKFEDEYGDRLMKSIDRKTAAEWGMQHRNTVKAIRVMYADAVRHDVVEHNPFADLRLPGSRGRKDIAPLTQEEVATLSDIAFKLSPGWPVMGAMITVAAYSGMRVGELSGLKWEDIDWAAGTIHVRRQLTGINREPVPPKNGKARVIAMLEQVANTLRDLPHENADGYVFYTSRGKGPFYSQLHQYFWYRVRAAFYIQLPADRQEKLGESLNFHELRHFCGSYLADRGVSAMDIALQLGHTDGGRLAQSLYIHAYEEHSLSRIRLAASGVQQERRDVPG